MYQNNIKKRVIYRKEVFKPKTVRASGELAKDARCTTIGGGSH
jgi:hypothetical protein